MKSSSFSSSSSSSVPRFSDAQSALFKCQLWHLRRANEIKSGIRELDAKLADKNWVLCFGSAAFKTKRAGLRRKLKIHQDAIEAITPFVSVPIASAKEQCGHGVPFSARCGRCESEMRAGPAGHKPRSG